VTAAFYATGSSCDALRAALRPDRPPQGHQIGPLFGVVAAILTWLTTNLAVIGRRLLEGASTAASVPSILGFIAMVTAGDELLRGRAAAVQARPSPASAQAPSPPVLYDGIPGVWGGLGRDAFLLNAGIVISFLIYRYGVSMPPAEDEAIGPPTAAGAATGRSCWLHVWLLAPTWIAINGPRDRASQTLFQPSGSQTRASPTST
jgi:hypothetical protein